MIILQTWCPQHYFSNNWSICLEKLHRFLGQHTYLSSYIIDYVIRIWIDSLHIYTHTSLLFYFDFNIPSPLSACVRVHLVLLGCIWQGKKPNDVFLFSNTIWEDAYLQCALVSIGSRYEYIIWWFAQCKPEPTYTTHNESRRCVRKEELAWVWCYYRQSRWIRLSGWEILWKCVFDTFVQA